MIENFNAEEASFIDNTNTSQEVRAVNTASNNEEYIVTGEQLLNRKVSELPFLVQGVFQQTGLVAVAGSSDTGKSSLLRQLSCAIVKGDDHFLDFKLNVRYGSVLYVSTEDDELAMSYLMNKQNPSYDASRFRGLRYIFDTTSLLEKLDEQLALMPVDAVFIDAWTDLYGGEINATNKVRHFLDQFRNLANKYDCLFVFLHHSRKGSDQSTPSKENLLGSQGFEAKMRAVIELRRDFNNSDLRHLCIVKGNYLPEQSKNASYVLHFDQNMTYSNTSKRVSFDQLAKPDPRQNNEAESRAKELRSQGYSLRETEAKLKEEGLPLGRTKISDLTRSSVTAKIKTKAAKPVADDFAEQAEKSSEDSSCPSVEDLLEDMDSGQSIEKNDSDEF